MQKNIDTLVFDLDDTLYPKSLGICKTGWERLASIFTTDIRHELGISHLTYKDFQEYGDEIFRKQENFDWDACMKYICSQDVSTIEFNKELKVTLEKNKCRKIIFTNSDYRHMNRVLNRLKLSEVFNSTFTCFDSEFHFKPEKKAFEIFIKKMNITPHKCAFFEDNLENIKIAKSFGMTTFLISEENIEKPKHCDFMFTNIVEALKSLSIDKP